MVLVAEDSNARHGHSEDEGEEREEEEDCFEIGKATCHFYRRGTT